MAENAVYGFGENYDLIDWSLNLVPQLNRDGDTDAVDHGIVTNKGIDEVPGVQTGRNWNSNYV